MKLRPIMVTTIRGILSTLCVSVVGLSLPWMSRFQGVTPWFDVSRSHSWTARSWGTPASGPLPDAWTT